MAVPSQTGTGFVNLSRYLDANKDTLGNEANNDAQAGQRAIATPQAATPADYVQNQQAAQGAYNNLKGLTNSGSLQDQIHKTYGGGQGQNAFDANLLGSSGQAQGAFANAQKGMAGLQSYISTPPVAPKNKTPNAPRPIGATPILQTQQKMQGPFGALPAGGVQPFSGDKHVPVTYWDDNRKIII